MKKMKKIALLFMLSIAMVSCNDDDDNTQQNVSIQVNLTQNWDGTEITEADLGTTVFTNQNGENLKITRLRYLISKVIIYNSFGDAIEVNGYNLADLSDDNSLIFAKGTVLPPGTYNKISFVYGFNEEDNIDNEYPDLNTAEWSWPDPLGGGYHFMQMDGTYVDPNGDNQPFNFHNGTARVSDGVFEQNFITVTVDNLSFSSSSVIEIKMNLAEWFKNPNTWDLNQMSTGLMGNYDAQIMMNANGQNVFSITVE